MSKIISRLGSWAAIWRHSSLPMLPPPPVTRMVLPCIWAKISPISTEMGGRPSRSSTATGRSLFKDTSPLASWYSAGSVLSRHPVSLHSVSSLPRSCMDRVGMAMRI